ncbi:MAG TPA: ion channel [Nocardioidaceae bacterium]|nr:ion channel [Nocardioidaceae bacterium]
MGRGVVAFVRQTPSAALLVAQLLGVLLYPFMEATPGGRPAFAIFGILVLSLAVVVARTSPFLSWVSTLIAAPAMVLLVLQVFTDSYTLFAWSSAFEAVLYFYAALSMTAYMLNDRRVTMDELFAIGTVFTLLAWAFAYVFVVLQALDPGSFSASDGEVHSWVDMLFLSFTVLTGTGMSDILPLTGHAKSVVMVEQAVGLFYVAMVVTRLIGLQAMRKQV